MRETEGKREREGRKEKGEKELRMLRDNVYCEIRRKSRARICCNVFPRTIKKYVVFRNWAKAAVYQCQFDFGNLTVTSEIHERGKRERERERSNIVFVY